MCCVFNAENCLFSIVCTWKRLVGVGVHFIPLFFFVPPLNSCHTMCRRSMYADRVGGAGEVSYPVPHVEIAAANGLRG